MSTIPSVIAYAMTQPYMVDAAGPPAVQCDLYNGVSGAATRPVGEIRGLENFGIWYIVVLLAIALLVSVIPALRRWVLSSIFWVIGILIGSAIIVAVVVALSTPTC